MANNTMANNTNISFNKEWLSRQKNSKADSGIELVSTVYIGLAVLQERTVGWEETEKIFDEIKTVNSLYSKIPSFQMFGITNLRTDGQVNRGTDERMDMQIDINWSPGLFYRQNSI